MRGRYIIHFLFLGFFLQGVFGQEQTLNFSGRFEDAGFKEFSELVGKQTGVSFFYKESWVRDIRITLLASDLPLLPVLDSILEPNGLSYFLDEWMHLFVLDSSAFIASLPEYAGSSKKKSEEADQDQADTDTSELTTAEKKYIDGRKVRIPEVIQVGSADKTNPGRNVLVTGQITDNESGEPLIGATLYISSLGKGTATGLDGRFNLLVKPGSYGVECNNMGMEPVQFTMVVHSDGEIKLSMNRTLIALDEVVVTAGQHDNVSGSQMGFERLNYSILKQVPLVMGERTLSM